MGRFYSMLILFCITLFLVGYFLLTPALNWGGDIIEYYGTSESVMNHFTPDLTDRDVTNLSKALNPAYLNDPQYYIQGAGGNRYPVHFFAYSLLLIPGRLFLQMLGQDQTKTFAVTNVLLFSLCVYGILRYFVHTERKRFLFMFLVYLSPVVSFFAWPGPEIFYISLVLLTVFLFASKRYTLAALAVTFASWHSQPLLVLAAGTYAFTLYQARKNDTLAKTCLQVAGLSFLAILPYMYNLVAFGVLTPWLKLQNIWTQYYGFGLHNITLRKWFEQFFDFDIGLFWYAPVIFLLGCYYAYRSFRHNRKMLVLALLFLLTAFFYQTNPAWNYGSAGYGPTRHVIYFLPLLLYFAGQLRRSHLTAAVLIFFVVTQLYILSFNGFLRPDFLASLRHNPIATYVLSTYPSLYNPTPELFVDRTNGTDLDYPTSAIFKTDGVCRKAYILTQDRNFLVRECGFVPAASPKIPDFTRTGGTVHTTEAVLTTKTKAPQLEANEVAKLATVDKDRVQAIDKGWHIIWGAPFRLAVPKGYEASYYSFAGSYINY